MITTAVLGTAAAVKKRRDKKGDTSGDEEDDRSGSDSDTSGDEEDDSGPRVYAMREKLLHIIKDDFTIKRMVKGRRRLERGKKAFKCENKVIHLRDTFELQSLGGDTLYQIKERKLRIRETMKIEDSKGDKIAEIKKREFGVVKDHYVVQIKGERNWEIHGSILKHDYTIREGGRIIATIHDKWIAPIQDCYFIDIDDGEDTPLALCVCIALDCIED